MLMLISHQLCCCIFCAYSYGWRLRFVKSQNSRSKNAADQQSRRVQLIKRVNLSDKKSQHRPQTNRVAYAHISLIATRARTHYTIERGARRPSQSHHKLRPFEHDNKNAA